MESRVIYVQPEQSIEECMAVMTDKDGAASSCYCGGKIDRHNIYWRFGKNHYQRPEIHYRTTRTLYARFPLERSSQS
jgi:hypothetical protein